jgi:hypothetical protein
LHGSRIADSMNGVQKATDWDLGTPTFTKVTVMSSAISRVLLAVFCAVSAGTGCADEPAATKPRRLAPAEVRVFSLQVTDVERDQFGNGKRPSSHDHIAFWLANSGTAIAGRFHSRDDVARFDEEASRLRVFRDDKGTDLTQPPNDEKIDTFFHANKPIVIAAGQRAGEGEFLVRGYRVPAEGATALHVEADLAFMLLKGRKTAEAAADLEMGSETEVGPVQFKVVNPDQFPDATDPPAPTAATHFAFTFEPPGTAVESVEWLGKNGAVLFGWNRPWTGHFTYLHERTTPLPQRVRVTYFESAERAILPLKFDTRLGLR